MYCILADHWLFQYCIYKIYGHSVSLSMIFVSQLLPHKLYFLQPYEMFMIIFQNIIFLQRCLLHCLCTINFFSYNNY
jgi:hypothetical protein